MGKIVTVSIIGCGSRGLHTYGKLMHSMPDKFKIVSLCDINPSRLEFARNKLNVDYNNCFDNPDEFFKEKRSDILVIATLDNDHINPAIKACKLGYNILLEKPISDKKEELNELSIVAKENHSFVMVCHVLRYTWANKTLMEIINSNRLGKLIQIDHSEQVAFWHFAHSYVRGNWRNLKVSAPMIMAKSCHDLDLLQEYAASKVESLSSVGTLNLFKKENKPEGASSRCIECKFKESCPYSAYYKYIMEWNKAGSPNCWPYNVITSNPTESTIMEALKNGPYGRCVYECDNDVVDNQSLMIKFENGIQATFRVSAFTKDCGRITILNFTHGQVFYEESKGTIIERPFAKDDIVHKYDASKDEFGHGGGDVGIVNALYKAITDPSYKVDTSLENSIESHLMAIAAEDSRIQGGKLVYLKDYRK